MLTITGANLVSDDDVQEQLSLFEDDSTEKREKQEHLEATIDKIRGKFGKKALSFGSILHNDLGIEEHPKGDVSQHSIQKIEEHPKWDVPQASTQKKDEPQDDGP